MSAPASLLDLIRPEVRAERAYLVPTEADARAKLDQNESPYDLPAELKRELALRFAEADWNRYPDDRPRRLAAALATKLGHPKDGLLFGRGSNDIVHTIGLAFLGRDVPVVLPRPMFALFESVARMHAARVVGVNADVNLRHDASAILRAAQEANAALTVVTTPNNPTGQTIPFEGVQVLAEGVPGFLLVDEAYYEFVEGLTADALVARHPNVLVLRTFSKAMGLAGLRIGYLLGDPDVIREVEKARLPFLVDRFSEEVALALLDRPALVAERAARLTAERERVLARLSGVDGAETLPGAANFFLLRTALPPRVLIERLAAGGVRIRDMSGYPALDGWARVSVGAPAENDAFLGALEGVLAEAAPARSQAPAAS
ncbi:MAG TPA: aminotransferase class I/II-fold pyridoxal phosphate-dependent enzyme [Rubricoccaceae bacterium]|nr:aminotransferase class I/II-fold pyridoxal phosphate-dependent enzyme [Rubricoccaceae bacterium]